jgi:hypothetical protein
MFERRILRGLMLAMGLALVVALLVPTLALAEKDPPVHAAGTETHDAALLDLEIDDNGGWSAGLSVSWPCPGDCEDHTAWSSLLAGTSGTDLADGNWDGDWDTVTNLSIRPGTASDEAGYAQYDYDGLLVSQSSCAWTDTGFVLVEYVIENTSSQTITDLYVGHDSDLDVAESSGCDWTGYDVSRTMGYNCQESASYCVGLRYFTGTSSYNNGDCCIFNDDSAAYTALSNGEFDSPYPTIGYTDVQFIMGAGPLTLAPGDAYLLGTAWVAGDTLVDMQTNADQALAMWLASDGCLQAPEEFVPEPGSVMLLASGLLGLAGYAGLRLRKK